MSAIDPLLAACTGLNLHPNGFVQFELGHRGLRLHAWGSDLPTQGGNARLHDHRFGFQSRVLVGELFNITYPFWKETPEGAYEVWGCTAKTDDNERQMQGVRRLGHRIELGPGLQEKVEAPKGRYVMHAREFHLTHVEAPTLTLMRKTDEARGHTARILMPVAETYEHDFRRDLTPAQRVTAWEFLEAHLTPRATEILERVL